MCVLDCFKTCAPLFCKTRIIPSLEFFSFSATWRTELQVGMAVKHFLKRNLRQMLDVQARYPAVMDFFANLHRYYCVFRCGNCQIYRLCYTPVVHDSSVIAVLWFLLKRGINYTRTSSVLEPFYCIISLFVTSFPLHQQKVSAGVKLLFS